MDTRLVSAVLGLLVGSGYLVVGAMIATQRRRGKTSFAAFWLGVGAYAVAEALWVFSAMAAPPSLPVALLVLQIKIVSIVAGFAGLVTYLVSVYTGSRAATRATLLAYVLVLVFVEWVYAMRQPVGVREGVWGLQLVYAVPSVEPWWTIMLAALLLPPTLAAIAYLSLARLADEPALRRRILLTGASLLLFFVPTFLAWRAGGWPWWGLTEKTLSALTAALMIAGQLAAREEGRRLVAVRRSRRDSLQEELAARAKLLI